MRALVLGGRGMLGQDLCRALSARGHEAIPQGSREVDIRVSGSVADAIRNHRADLVINCAGYTAVDRAEEEEEEAFSVNARGAGLAAAGASGAEIPFIHISTDYVFDGRKEGGYLEDDPVHPLSVYGRSKAEGEQRVREAHSGACVVRTQWLYGHAGANFVETMLRLGSERDRISVVDDQFGSPTWTFDLAAALVVLAESGAQGTYHLTNSEVVSWYDFAKKIFEIEGMELAVEPVPTTSFPRPASRPLRGVLRNHVWQADGHTPLRSWTEALSAYLQERRERT
ncbi:MAG: dTDP-4-dehydrorhamnose reductase [Myxococcota bacterium]|nr:dTDP-4-dehydrorhamnose reductase [Myxococcota bacterium]